MNNATPNKMTRRGYLKSVSATALLPFSLTTQKKLPPLNGGIALNEDNSHYFSTRAGQKLDAATVASFIDQYANTQVRELMFSMNAMRTSFDSRVWNPIWHGYDPNAPDDQPLFASMPAAARANARKWVHTAWQLNRDGVDVYALWIARARRHGIAPWLSMRMNDVHEVNDEQSYMHSDFWRAHPEYRRVSYHLERSAARAFDYGHQAVRDYHFKLVHELVERYDIDGFELDWMRFGYHFKPGHEQAGLALLTDFTAQVRDLLNHWERRRGHRIKLGARVPSRPATARGLGYDVTTWAQRKLIDMLVVTPFWATAETDMPIELWKELLRGTNVTLAAGLEVLLRSHPDSKQFQMNTIETARGIAAAMLDRGADRIYLFNYMDSQTAMDGLENYPALLREVGQLATLARKPRRHIMTFADTWAPGEPSAIPLPQTCKPGRWYGFRLATGPVPTNAATAFLGIEGLSAPDAQACHVRINGEACAITGLAQLANPKPEAPVYRIETPRTLIHRGYNVIEFSSPKLPCQIVWVEISL
jgi:hypothetical protein